MLEELDRYQPGAIVLANRQLAETRVTGNYKLDDPAATAYTFNVGPTRLTTQLNVNNIFDKHYFFAGQPYNTAKAFNMVADPLTVLGSVRLEY